MSNNIFSYSVGQVFYERYQILKELGCNVRRRTFLAEDLQNKQLVVIKVLLFNSDFYWEDLKLFKREVETLKSLCHPAIPSYLEYLELNTSSFNGFALIQTYINATSLQEQLKLGRTFSETEVKQLAKSLLSVLNYLHSQQPPVIHRDIKPSNILLTNRSAHSPGDIYLVDFGSVHSASHQDGTITIAGTYGYMPPEQFSGKAFPASDLYSLGATLIYLVTGIEPADLPLENLQIQFEGLTNISPDFTSWLKSIINPHLQERFTSAQEALQALEASNISLISKQPQKFQKPSKSKISLTKTVDKLEIIIRYKTVDKIIKAITQSKNKTINNYKLILGNIFKWPLTSKWIIALILLLVVLSFIPVLSVAFGVYFVLLQGIFISYPIFIALLCTPCVIVVANLIRGTINILSDDVQDFGESISYNTIPNTNIIDKMKLGNLKINRSLNNQVKSIDSLHIKIQQEKIYLGFTYISQSNYKRTYPIVEEVIQNVYRILLQKETYIFINNNESQEVIEVPPRLFLEILNNKYAIDYQLTPSEINWLAQEISEYLGMTITKD